MSYFKKAILFLRRFFSPFQIIVLGLIVAYAFIFNESNIFTHLKLKTEISQLESQIKHYQEKIDEDTRKIQELDADKDEIEKFSRENYYMKKPNEDIFLIKD